jgi:asparagine synthetase B (glutamine-hydrolysing)
MSGLIGLLDGRGVNEDLVRSAAAASGFRGEPILLRVKTGVMGVFAHPDEEPGLIATSGSVLASDARVDAYLAEHEGLPPADGHRGIALLDAVLRRFGPMGLDDVAADFAIAWWREDGTLILARDAFALRPLVWARSEGRLGFASDPGALLEMGVASSDLDPEAIRGWLTSRDSTDERTAFLGVRRVLGGHWVAFHPDGSSAGGRWFRPERIRESTSPLDALVLRARSAIRKATASRVGGRRVALLLTGGRDSGTVAAALPPLSDVTAITAITEPEPKPPDRGPARSLASALGLRHVEVEVPAMLTEEMVMTLVEVGGSPLTASLPTALALQRCVRKAGATSVLTGDGGELFFAPPVALADLLRAGRLDLALRALRAYARDWHYSPSTSLKWTGRAFMPALVLRLRERWRATPPWVVDPLAPRTQFSARSARSELLNRAVKAGRSAEYEFFNRLFARVNATYACPLLDLRVVRVALSLPARYLVPFPEAKVVPSRALLGSHSRTRVKANYSEFFDRLALQVQRDFPTWVASGNLLSRQGLVEEECLAAMGDPRWRVSLPAMLVAEGWLRSKGSVHGRPSRT